MTIAAITLTGVIVVDVLRALLLAVALAVFDAIRRSAKPATLSSAESSASTATPM